MMRRVQRNSEFGIRNSECRLFSRQSRGALTFRNPQSAIRIGLTLIELLVVIVILMTLVGGVIPVLSPNNEARKIREASRGLQTYVMQAQARAARTGRPVGIAFRETSSGSGVALEVFQIEVPPPFTGFSSSSTAIFNRVSLPEDSPQVYEIHFGEMSGASFDATEVVAIPPRMTRPGDWIRVGNGLFQLKASGRGGELERVGNIRYFKDPRFYRHAELISGSAPPTFAVDFVTTTDQAAEDEVTIGINSTSQLRVVDYPRHWSHPSSYRIVRQPVTTGESPYTLPAGVAIDMHASGTEGGAEPTLFAKANYYTNAIKQIGIMFSPSGGIDSIHYNGAVLGLTSEAPYKESIETPITDASRVFLLLARVENVLDEDAMLANGNKSTAWISKSASDEQLAELQGRINWLNMDSRWIVFDTRSGRSVVTENTFVDARRLVSPVNTALDQLDAAREFARQMRSGGGR